MVPKRPSELPKWSPRGPRTSSRNVRKKPSRSNQHTNKRKDNNPTSRHANKENKNGPAECAKRLNKSEQARHYFQCAGDARQKHGKRMRATFKKTCQPSHPAREITSKSRTSNSVYTTSRNILLNTKGEPNSQTIAVKGARCRGTSMFLCALPEALSPNTVWEIL